MRRIVGQKLLILTLALAVWTCAVAGGCAKQPAGREKVLTVGVMGPFTGPSSKAGEELKGAAILAFERVGYKVGEYTVKLVWIDSQDDPEKAARAYEDAVLRDNITCGIMNWHSSTAVACMEVAAKHKVPHFFGHGATEVVNQKYASDPQKYSYWMGKTWPTPSKLVVAYVEALEEAISKGILSLEEKKAAIYGEDTDWGRSFGKAMTAELEKAGWMVVSHDYFPVRETEFYPLLTKLKSAKVSVIAGTISSAPSFAAFVKQARQVGLNCLIIADGLGWVGEWYELAGDASDYVLDQVPKWTKPAAKQFRDDFVKKWGFNPSPLGAGLAYDQACFFIKLAEHTLAKYGELTRETLYKVGQEDLWGGKLTFTEGILMDEYKYTPETIPDPIVGPGYFIFPVIQYFSGEGKIIWPAQWKEADLQVPAGMKK